MLHIRHIIMVLHFYLYCLEKLLELLREGEFFKEEQWRTLNLYFQGTPSLLGHTPFNHSSLRNCGAYK